MKHVGSDPLRCRTVFFTVGFILLSILALCFLPAASAMDDSDCMLCHQDKTLSRTNALGEAASLFVDLAVLKGSVHRTKRCASCHSDLTDRHPDDHLAPKPVDCTICHAEQSESYGASVHGITLKLGEEGSATCKDCHGNHGVLPHTDPRSSIHTNNLVQTCGKCHPGATENFVVGKIHVAIGGGPPPDFGGVINLWVRRVYLVLIVGTIGLMLAHNGLLWLRKIARIYQGQHRPLLRMDLNQRWQHFLLLASFLILAVTGFALKWPDSWIAKLLGSHEEFRRWSHRIAGIVMLTLGLYHILYLIFSRKGGQLFRDFLPAKKDAADLVQNARFLLGKSQARARFTRFGYTEKMEYWAVVWGTIIMGVTGLMIWFKMDVTQYLPRWVVEVATTIHYYEAILACLAILVWHLYHVILDPDVYPGNFAFWDGRVSEHWQQEEHPLETNVPRADARQGAYRQEMRSN
jgi:formate dehydrogenase gamma subunit